MADNANTKPANKRPRKMARNPKAHVGAPVAAAPVASPQSNSSIVLELLARPDGATIDQLVEATGWLPHTTRAALTGLKKKGHALTSEKVENKPRIYRVAHEAAQCSSAVGGAAAMEPAG